MTTQEFSYEFDILYNNIMSNAAPGLNEYEKSVFLTKAQEELVISIYSGRNVENSFEQSEEARRYLDNLVTTYSPTRTEEESGGLSPDSIFYFLPDSLWFITYESVDLEDDRLSCNKIDNVAVIPITQDYYHKLRKNPFRGPSDRRVFRLDIEGNRVELISKYKVKNYKIRYIRRPNPIILEDLEYGATINNMSEKTECELNTSLHRAILDRAVVLAKAAYVGNIGR